MARGGARPNSGPKVGPDGKALKPYRRKPQNASTLDAKLDEAAAKARTPMPAEAKTAAQRPMFSSEAVMAIIEAMEGQTRRARNRPRTMDWNPYVIRPERFGPVVDHIKRHKPQLALDSSSRGVGRRSASMLALDNANQYAVQAWQAGGLLNNVVSEGLLFLGYPYLSELSQRVEFRNICEIRAEEMVRKWTRFRGTEDKSTKGERSDRNQDDEEADRRRRVRGEKPRDDKRNKEIESRIKELQDFVEDLKVRSWFKDAFAQDNFFGISHLMLDLKGTDINNWRDPELAKPIGNGRDKFTEAKLVGKRNFLKGIRTIEPIWCYPTVYNAQNPLVPTWYDPQVWYVMGAEIHKTRLLPLIGRPVADILRPAYAFGGMSLSQLSQPYVDIWLRIRESVGEIVNAYSVMVLLTSMATQTQPGGSGGGNGDVVARSQLFNWLRDNQGIFLLDKNSEDFKNVSVPLSGLDELQAQAQEHLAAPARIPIVKLFGIHPKGLNATSETELRAFEETVSGQQEHFRPQMTTVYDLAQISLWGQRDPDITYDFVELREETPKEQAEINKLKAETDQILVDGGLIWPEEGRQRLATDPDSGYDSITVDDVPDLLDEEEEGLEPEGGRPQPQAEIGEQREDASDDAPSAEEARRNAFIAAGGSADE